MYTRHGFLTPATRRSPFTLPRVNPYPLSRVGGGQGKGQGHAGVTLGLPVTITTRDAWVTGWVCPAYRLPRQPRIRRPMLRNRK